jgi:outer membrane lipoprotein
MTLRITYAVLLAAALSGCASDIPRPIRHAPATQLDVATARRGVEQLRGTPVRWGGTIASVENRATETWVEVVEQPLDSSGRPKETDQSGGRFIASIDGFVDPHVYSNGRQVTVAGTLEKTVTRKIGEFPYDYPVVKAETHYLWATLQELSPAYYYGPYWYDPWYPWGYPPYPYYYYRHYPYRYR